MCCLDCSLCDLALGNKEIQNIHLSRDHCKTIRLKESNLMFVNTMHLSVDKTIYKLRVLFHSDTRRRT